MELGIRQTFDIYTASMNHKNYQTRINKILIKKKRNLNI